MKKTIFITGAGHGIGKATAQLFAQKGWFLGLLDINQGALEVLAQEIGETNCCTYVADVTSEGQVEESFADFGKRVGGKLDVLFNNAGILLAGGFEKPSLAQHKKVVDVNFNGVMVVAYFALPLLKNTPQSVLVNTASISALYGNPELTAYAATKSAVKSLTEGWYYLYAKHGVHVCDLLPAYTNTPMLEHAEETMGVRSRDIKVSAQEVARACWKAVHSKKLHHYVGQDAHMMRILMCLLPHWAVELIVRHTYYKKAIQDN